MFSKNIKIKKARVSTHLRARPLVFVPLPPYSHQWRTRWEGAPLPTTPTCRISSVDLAEPIIVVALPSATTASHNFQRKVADALHDQRRMLTLLP